MTPFDRDLALTRAEYEAGAFLYRVLPRSKAPAESAGYRDRPRPSWEEIEAHARGGGNVGMLTGAAYGRVVVDYDAPDVDLGDRDLPPTRRVRTARGGHDHYTVDHGARVPSTTGKIAEHVDILGDGKCVLLPPSIHPSGVVYEWADPRDPAPAPGWLLEPERPEVVAGPSRDRDTGPYLRALVTGLETELASTPEGDRNNTLYRAAVRAGQKGAHRSDAMAGLVAAGVAAGLDEPSARRSCKSGLDWGYANPTAIQDRPLTGRKSKGQNDPLIVPPPDGPQPLYRAAPAVMAYDHAMMPESMAPWIADTAERMQVPPDYIAAAALVAASSLAARHCCMRPKRCDNWTVHPNTWGGILDRASRKKTPAINAAIAPLRVLEARAIEEHKALEARHRADVAVADGRAKALRAAIEKACKAGDETEARRLAERMQAEALEPPAMTRYLIGDATSEALGGLLQHNPCILQVWDELSGWLAGFNKTGRETERAFALACWDGAGSFTFDRIGRGRVHVPHARLALFGGIQPGPFAQYMASCRDGDGGDGLLARLQVLVAPDPPAAWRHVDRDPDWEAQDRAHAAITALADPHGLPEPGPRETMPTFRFDDAGQACFDRWQAEFEPRLLRGDEPPAFEAHLSKYRSLFPSIALVLHLLEGGRGPVGLPSAMRAGAWLAFLETHAKRAYGLGAVDPGLSEAERLLRWLAARVGKTGEPVPMTDIYQFGPAGCRDRASATRPLEILLAHGLVARVTDAVVAGRTRRESWTPAEGWERALS